MEGWARGGSVVTVDLRCGGAASPSPTTLYLPAISVAVLQWGKTALYQAALGGQRATMEKLIEFGANIEARNPVSGLVWWWS